MQACFAQPSILRKPLLSSERHATKKTILVTGATGYIGSRVVERLLAGGHDVHVLCRPRSSPSPQDVLHYLKALPGAAQRLTVISGDVTDAAGLQCAMKHCQQLVHLAAVVDVLPPRDEQHKQQMIDTALQGTRMVLDAATASGTIDKVILASSIVAVMWDWWERGKDHVYTEEDWTLDSSVALNCYAYCKRESERLAYQMAQGQRWELATINPGIVFGPVGAPKLAESASVWTPIVEHMNGSKYPFTSNLYVSHVDLDDVAAATCGLLATPGAIGRHLLMSGPPPSMPQIAALLAKAYPTAKVPFLTAPGLCVALVATYYSSKLGFDVHKFWAMHNKPYNVDASKIKRVLPDFEYIPLEASVQSAADSIVGMGLAAFYDSSSRSCWGLWPAGGLCGRRPAAAAPAAVGPANDAAAAAQAPALAAVKASLSAPTCPQISIGNDDEQQQQQQQQKVRLAEVLATTESTGPPDVSSGVLALIVSPRVPEPKGTATHQAEAEQQV